MQYMLPVLQNSNLSETGHSLQHILLKDYADRSMHEGHWLFHRQDQIFLMALERPIDLYTSAVYIKIIFFSFPGSCN